MKVIFLLLTLLFLVPSLSAKDFCKKDNDNKSILSTCELYDQSVDNAVELTVYKDYCSESSSGDAYDCFYVKTCHKDEADVESSIGFNNSPAHMKTACSDAVKGKYLFFGDKKDKGFKAYISCVGRKPRGVVLETPSGRTKLCKVSFFK